MSRVRPYLVVAAVAATVRLVLHAGNFGGALTAVPVGDERMYAAWAAKIAEGSLTAGDGTGPEGLYHAPGYAWFLGAIHGLFDSAPDPDRAPTTLTILAHSMLGIATALFVFAATRRVFGRATGWVAGLLYAAVPAALFYESFYGKTALAQCTVAAALWALVRLRDRASDGRSIVAPAVGFGLVVGVGALVQELTLVLLPLAMFVGRRARVPRIGALGLATVGLVVGLSPQFLRNAVLGEPLLQMTVNSGQNLWIGSGAGADGFYRPIYEGRGTTGTERADARRAAQFAAGRTLAPNEISEWWRDRALTDIRSEPLRFAALYARKLGAIVAAEEWMDSRALRAHRTRSTLLDVLAVVFHFGVLASLAAMALVRRIASGRHGHGEDGSPRPRFAPFVLGTSALGGGLALFLVYGRLRLSLAIFLIPLAADGLLALVDLARGRVAAGFWILVFPMALWASTIPNEDEVHPVATTWSNVAAAHVAAGRMETAWTLASEAIATAPESADAWLLYGELSLARGELDDGRTALRSATRLEPAYGFPAMVTLAEAELARGDAEASRRALADAMEYPSTVAEDLGRAALLWRRLGELKRAGDLYQRALSLDPEDAVTHGNYGYLEMLRDRPRSAVQHYERALDLDPTNVRTTLNLAWARAASPVSDLRDSDEANALVDRAAELLPAGDAEILDARAAIEASVGNFEAAAALAERAARAASASGRSSYAKAIEQRRALYRAGEPFRQGSRGRSADGGS